MKVKITNILIYSLIIIVLLLLPLIFKQSGYLLHILILCAINVMLASSLRAIITTGQISLGHAGFMSIGAYTSGILVMKFGLPTYAGLLLGGIAAMAVAAIIAFPVTRVRTIYLAMLTLFLGEIIRLIITEWRGVTGGTNGLINISPLDSISFFGIFTVDFATRLPNYYFILIITLLVLLFLYMIDRSYIGMTLKAIAQDEDLAASSGINVTRYKVIIFCIGCFVAGLAGSFFAHYVSVITPDSFGIFPSLYVIVYIIVGGPRRFAGAIVGAIILTIVPELVRGLQEYTPFVFVAVLYLVIFLLPGGLASLPERIRLSLRMFNRRNSSRAGN